MRILTICGLPASPDDQHPEDDRDDLRPVDWDDEQWDAFLPDDEQFDPLPEPGDFWGDLDMLAKDILR